MRAAQARRGNRVAIVAKVQTSHSQWNALPQHTTPNSIMVWCRVYCALESEGGISPISQSSASIWLSRYGGGLEVTSSSARRTTTKLDMFEADRDFPWDDYISSSPQGCFFHLSGMIEALKHLTGSTLHRLVFRKGRQVVALCPVFLFERGPLRSVYSPPLLGAAHHMGPVFVGYETLTPRRKSELLFGFQGALDDFLTTKIRCNYVEMKYPPGFLDARSLQWAGYNVTLLYTRLLDLKQGVENIWGQCRADLRRNVKKCESHVISREATPGELRDFMRIVRQRYRNVDVAYPLTEAFLTEVFKVLGPNQIRLFVAEESGVIQTGLILAMHGNRATIWHGSIRPRTSRLPINDHLHWFAVSWAQRQDFGELEIMGADNPRLEEFKSKFNARLVPCLHAERARSWYRLAERIGREPPSLF